MNWLVEHRAAIERFSTRRSCGSSGTAKAPRRCGDVERGARHASDDDPQHDGDGGDRAEERRGCDTSGSAGGWLAALAVLFARRAPRHGRTQAIGAA